MSFFERGTWCHYTLFAISVAALLSIPLEFIVGPGPTDSFWIFRTAASLVFGAFGIFMSIRDAGRVGCAVAAAVTNILLLALIFCSATGLYAIGYCSPGWFLFSALTWVYFAMVLAIGHEAPVGADGTYDYLDYYVGLSTYEMTADYAQVQGDFSPTIPSCPPPPRKPAFPWTGRQKVLFACSIAGLAVTAVLSMYFIVMGLSVSGWAASQGFLRVLDDHTAGYLFGRLWLPLVVMLGAVFVAIAFGIWCNQAAARGTGKRGRILGLVGGGACLVCVLVPIVTRIAMPAYYEVTLPLIVVICVCAALGYVLSTWEAVTYGIKAFNERKEALAVFEEELAEYYEMYGNAYFAPSSAPNPPSARQSPSRAVRQRRPHFPETQEATSSDIPAPSDGSPSSNLEERGMARPQSPIALHDEPASDIGDALSEVISDRKSTVQERAEAYIFDLNE